MNNMFELEYEVAYLYFFDSTSHTTGLASCVFGTLPLLWLLTLLGRHNMRMPGSVSRRRIIRCWWNVSIRGGRAVKRCSMRMKANIRIWLTDYAMFSAIR